MTVLGFQSDDEVANLEVAAADGEYKETLGSTSVHEAKMNSDWSVDRRGSIKLIMDEKKEQEVFRLPEDVFAFIIVAPYCSTAFLFACWVFILKIVIYAILITGISFAPTTVEDEEDMKTTVVKFFLIPVSLAMQEDLMESYFFFANVLYNKEMLKNSSSATSFKLYLSYIMRVIDGILSLVVNYGVMLSTHQTLSVFLNFAALGFLQSIDDIFYELVGLGFMGDAMEHMSTICKDCFLKRRHGECNRRFLFLRISHLDTIFFFVTLFILLIWWLATNVDYLKPSNP